MKRLAALFSVLVSLLLFAPTPVLATQTVSLPLCPSSFGALCNLQPQNTGGMVGVVLQVLFIIAIVVCLFFLVWGGVRWIMSGGDKGKVQQARSTIVAALVGLAISLCAFGILNFVLIFFTGQGISAMKLPKLYGN